jgi:hypothetical protein
MVVGGCRNGGGWLQMGGGQSKQWLSGGGQL